MFKMYLDELISAGRQSAVRDTLEAVNFAKHVLGISVDPGLLDHPWAKASPGHQESKRRRLSLKVGLTRSTAMQSASSFFRSTPDQGSLTSGTSIA